MRPRPVRRRRGTVAIRAEECLGDHLLFDLSEGARRSGLRRPRSESQEPHRHPMGARRGRAARPGSANGARYLFPGGSPFAIARSTEHRHSFGRRPIAARPTSGTRLTATFTLRFPKRLRAGSPATPCRARGRGERRPAGTSSASAWHRPRRARPGRSCRVDGHPWRQS